MITSLTQSLVWLALKAHQSKLESQHLRSLFAEDPHRFEKFSIRFNDFLLDFSKQPVTNETMNLLFKLATQQKLNDWIAQMFRGEKINVTEHRAALHIALRANQTVTTESVDILPAVKQVLQQMESFTQAVHQGIHRGYSGLTFTDVVNIGIGGSDLGPVMVTEALKPYWNGQITPHFVSNIDGAHLAETLKALNPATTLFVIASKTFTTLETIANAHAARTWFLTQGGSEKEIARHFVAVSTNQKAVQQFGIDPANMFVFWDWVGGRYSLWSAIGLSIALTLGMQHFYDLLSGARQMDQHFLTTPFAENLPVILGLIGIWQINFLGATSHAILPYDQSLHRFPAYLQQLEMESNGKSVTRDGTRVDYQTGTVVWGESGTNGQHAFYQLLHQGTPTVTADFLAPCQSHYAVDHHHQLLLANFFAQTEALMLGKTADEVQVELQSQGYTLSEIEQLAPHRVFAGNHATTSILFKKLDPKTLGSLIALYEHKVFVQSVIWNINPFDQWGVELGKQLANKIMTDLKTDQKVTAHDASTNGLINYFKENSDISN